jgi:hypothetical protein
MDAPTLKILALQMSERAFNLVPHFSNSDSKDTLSTLKEIKNLL